MTPEQKPRLFTVLQQAIFDTVKGLLFFMALAFVPTLIVLLLGGLQWVPGAEPVDPDYAAWALRLYGDSNQQLAEGLLYSFGYALFWGIGGIGLGFRLVERVLGSWLGWLIFGVALSGISIAAITIYAGAPTLFAMINLCLYWWFLPPLAYLASQRLGWGVGLLLGVFSLRYLWAYLAGTFFHIVPLRDTASEEVALYSILVGMVACAYFAHQALRLGVGLNPAPEQI